jgi:hypothetical protein
MTYPDENKLLLLNSLLDGCGLNGWISGKTVFPKIQILIISNPPRLPTASTPPKRGFEVISATFCIPLRHFLLLFNPPRLPTASTPPSRQVGTQRTRRGFEVISATFCLPLRHFLFLFNPPRLLSASTIATATFQPTPDKLSLSGRKERGGDLKTFQPLFVYPSANFSLLHLIAF